MVPSVHFAKNIQTYAWRYAVYISSSILTSVWAFQEFCIIIPRGNLSSLLSLGPLGNSIPKHNRYGPHSSRKHGQILLMHIFQQKSSKIWLRIIYHILQIIIWSRLAYPLIFQAKISKLTIVQIMDCIICMSCKHNPITCPEMSNIQNVSY